MKINAISLSLCTVFMYGKIDIRYFRHLGEIFRKRIIRSVISNITVIAKAVSNSNSKVSK